MPKPKKLTPPNLLKLKNSIVGIDEVGRGCWAGPLVAAAVLLNKSIVGLRDSKKLSKQQRQILAAIIEAEALSYGIGWVSPTEVDELGLTKAVSLAMRRALAAIAAPYDQIIIDGNYNFLPEQDNVQTIVKADDSVPAVSAASIIAKVARDDYMAKVAQQYPDYGFERHVGYGTAQHRVALAAHGPCKIHRMSYKPLQALLH